MSDPTDDDPTTPRPDAADFGALFENTSDAIAAIELRDERFIVTAVNPAFEATFGYDAEEIVGEDIDAYVIPDEAADAAESVGDQMQLHEQVDAEVRRRTADGIRDFRIRTVPLERGGGWTDGYAIYTDITDQKTRQKRLEQFTQLVSHDLRNPLQVATGEVEVARTHESPPEVESALETTHVALDRMAQIISNLLVLTRGDERTLNRRRTDVGAAAERAWTNVDTGPATLDCRGDVTVAADRSRLGHCLENLFRNALAHGGDDVTVTVGPLDDEGFYVADDGPGIPAAERDRVFDDGYTTTDDGTGLGLSIVEMVATAHDWAVTVTESASGGARFEIRTDQRTDTRDG